jgi:hypothetical protein
MLRVKLLPILFVLPLSLLGCADDSVSDDGADDLGEGDTDGTGTDEGEPANWIPARGIGIIEVEANQGTRVPIGGPDGAWVDGAGRNTFLTSERDTLIRVHWEIAEGWEPHEVQAKLSVHKPGGEVSEKTQEVLVEGDSTPTSLSRTFFFGLAAENGETAPGTKYQVELFEKDTEQDADLPELAAINPADGPNFIGYEQAPMELKVMLVPVHYTGEGKDLRPDLTDENINKMIDALYEQNPVQEVTYQVRSEVGYSNTLTNLGALLPIMASAKQNDGADPNLYYHALINPGCAVVGCGNAGVAGIAQIANDSKSDSLSRVAATIFYNIDSTADTFVHEVGHNQGFAHVACPNANAAGPDPSYPYPDGKIGNWGFGIRGFSLHNPTASHDYMTYCGNTWASDWTFNKAYNRIKTLTSWDYEGAPAPGQEPGIMGERLLIGALYPDGSEEWFTLDGGIDVEEIRPGEGVEFAVAGQLIEQPAVVRTLSDDQTQWVMVPLPEAVEIDEVDGLTHLRDGAPRREISPAEVRVPTIANDWQ